MKITSDIKTYTASEAREKLYKLIKAAGTGLASFEITLRGNEPVILINKAELESWQETLDILSNKKEIASIRKAIKQKRVFPHDKVLTSIGLKNEAGIQTRGR
jgi:prevent-host-death family protein